MVDGRGGAASGAGAGCVPAQQGTGFAWGQGLIFFAVAYCVGLGFRLIELPQWLAGDFRLDGQFLLATADGYHWLARAENVPFSELVDAGRSAVPDLLSLLAGLFGTTPGKLAFWLPVALAPLAALPVCLVAARWGMPAAGLWAGTMTVVAPGYMQRTRLGFLDDDMIFVPAALMLMGGLVLLLTPYCRESWTTRGMEKTSPARPSPASILAGAVLLAGALALGLWARLCVWVYPRGFSLIFAAAVLALLAGLVLARPGSRLLLAGAFALLFSAWLGPWPVAAALGCAAAAGLGLAQVGPVRDMAGRLKDELASRSFRVPGPLVWAPLSALVLAVAGWLSRGAWLPALEWTWTQVRRYYQAWAVEDTRMAVFFGDVAELTRLTPTGTAQLLSGHWVLAGLAVAGFGLLLWKRPLAAVFLPLGGIAAVSFFMGARFTLFSASFFGLGLGCGLVLLLRRLRLAPARQWLPLTLLLPAVFWYPWLHARAVWPEPTVTLRMAENLRELSGIAPEDALLWNRWDIGAAVNYYSRRRSVEMSLANLGVYTRALAQEDKTAARELILERGKDREHYVIVDWQGLARLETLLATGTFDRGAGQSAKTGSVQRLTGGFYFELDHGVMVAPDRQVPLRTLTSLEDGGEAPVLRRHSWTANTHGVHVVLDQLAGTGYLMDSTCHATMFVQLLLQPAPALSPEFELILDDFPAMRVFRVGR